MASARKVSSAGKPASRKKKEEGTRAICLGTLSQMLWRLKGKDPGMFATCGHGELHRACEKALSSGIDYVRVEVVKEEGDFIHFEPLDVFDTSVRKLCAKVFVVLSASEMRAAA